MTNFAITSRSGMPFRADGAAAGLLAGVARFKKLFRFKQHGICIAINGRRKQEK